MLRSGARRALEFGCCLRKLIEASVSFSEEFVRFGILRRNLNGFAEVSNGFLGSVLVEKQVGEVNEGSSIFCGRVLLPLHGGAICGDGAVAPIRPRLG